MAGPVTFVLVPAAGAAAVGYLLWQRQRQQEAERQRQREAEQASRSPVPKGPYTPPPEAPERHEVDITELGPPGPDQVAGYKKLFNDALEEERYEEAAHLAGLLRAAGEEAWADNAAELIDNARKRA